MALSQLQLLGRDRAPSASWWSSTRRRWTSQRRSCLHDFVARQVEKTPDAAALVCGDERLSYRELNARANQLAHYLIKRGAGPEVLVGIHARAQRNMLVGILGHPKVGQRLRAARSQLSQRAHSSTFCKDAAAPLVVTQNSIADDLPDFAGQRIALDGDWPAISQEPTYESGDASRPGQSGLRAVYLRFDRTAEGSGHRASQRRDLCSLGAGGVHPAGTGRRAAVDFDVL